MAITTVASFINHDLHTRFGILKAALGKVEAFAGKLSLDQQDQFEDDIRLMNETLDQLSITVMNFTDCLDLEKFSDEGQKVDVNFQLARNKELLAEKGLELEIEQQFLPVYIHEAKFAFIMNTLLSFAVEFSNGRRIRITGNPGNQLHLEFSYSSGSEGYIKELKEVLMGRSKVHSLPGMFDLYFSNYLLERRGGGIFIEYLSPGEMSVKVRWTS